MGKAEGQSAWGQGQAGTRQRKGRALLPLELGTQVMCRGNKCSEREWDKAEPQRKDDE